MLDGFLSGARKGRLRQRCPGFFHWGNDAGTGAKNALGLLRAMHGVLKRFLSALFARLER